MVAILGAIPLIGRGGKVVKAGAETKKVLKGIDDAAKLAQKVNPDNPQKAFEIAKKAKTAKDKVIKSAKKGAKKVKRCHQSRRSCSIRKI